MFHPNRAVADRVLKSSATLASEFLAADSFEAERFPPRDRVFDQIDSREVEAEIGERLIDVLGVLARQQASHNPHSHIVVLTEDQMFSPSLHDLLKDQLNLVGQEKPDDALTMLAADFDQWIRRHADDRDSLKLQYDPQGRLLLLCEPLSSEL